MAFRHIRLLKMILQVYVFHDPNVLLLRTDPGMQNNYLEIDLNIYKIQANYNIIFRPSKNNC